MKTHGPLADPDTQRDDLVRAADGVQAQGPSLLGCQYLLLGPKRRPALSARPIVILVLLDTPRARLLASVIALIDKNDNLGKLRLRARKCWLIASHWIPGWRGHVNLPKGAPGQSDIYRGGRLRDRRG